MVSMSLLTCKVDNQGRVMLPADWRKRFQIGPSTQLVVREQSNGSLVLETREQGLRRAQLLVSQYVKSTDRSLVDELLEDRRKEAESE